jgi:phosphatidylethanolamine-binding protein (PEBP) family uncharacterized protein
MKRLLFFLAACGGGNAPPIDSKPILFQMTSPTIEWEGDMPATHTCAGANTSPEIIFNTNRASTANSFALVMTVGASRIENYHWMMYDIILLPGVPANIDQAYVANVPGGAKQARNPDGSFGYRGPCPTERKRVTFAAYQMDVQNLPGVTQDSSYDELFEAMTKHSVGEHYLLAFASP